MTPSLGAVLVGFLIMAVEVAKWFPGVKPLRGNPLGSLGDLAPFILSWCAGCLTIMVGGGIIGWAGDKALWGVGFFGDGVLIYGVGAEAGTAPGGSSAPLDQGGLFMTLLVICVFFARVGRGQSAHKWRGYASGFLTGLSKGVLAYAAVPLASLANLSGAWLTGAMNG